MFPVRFVCLVLALVCVVFAAFPALAAQVDCDTTYCFTAQDFSRQEEPLAGICITGLPEGCGTVFLGSRILQSGDILTAGQVEQMTFCPAQGSEDTQAVISYLPIYENRVEPAATMTLSIRAKRDETPVAQDSSLETYQNLPNQGKLHVTDPEGQALTYTLVRAPRRGEVALQEDGSFTYTPKKNKVGVDSFTYTAADPAGNVSREATVTIQILKPSDARQYADTVGMDCRFSAEWLRNTGLFTAENVGGEHCFHPDKTVSRGDFMAMLLSALDIPTESAAGTDWLQPYLEAAQRSGLLNRLPENTDVSFDLQAPISGAEAAVMVQNALDLPLSRELLETAALEQAPSWASAELEVLAERGIDLPGEALLTRADVACLLYEVCQIAPDAPGMAVIRRQQ